MEIVELNKPEVISIIESEMKDAIENGARLLDKQYGTDWPERIDTDELDMSNCSKCVLGQLYNSYIGGLGKLNLGLWDGKPFGFDTNNDLLVGSKEYKLLTQLWKQKIQQIRGDKIGNRELLGFSIR